MKEYGIFDVLGPIMIGPSSSHTAGAARLGKMSQIIVSEPFKKIVFNLHGSFAKTASGHGTDRALLAGVLGMEPDDARLANSFEIAKEKGLDFEFKEKDLGNVHPNTVKLDFTLENGNTYYVIGSSIGGGSIVIKSINGTDVSFSGNRPTILIENNDTSGVIAHISNILAKSNINISTMTVTPHDGIATMVIEVDSYISDQLLKEIDSLDDILYLKGINPNKE